MLKYRKRLKGEIGVVECKEYLALLKEWKNEKVIKVVTGIRRCGKSTLLALF